MDVYDDVTEDRMLGTSDVVDISTEHECNGQHRFDDSRDT